MADVKWIKLYVDMFDNKKIKFIRKLPEGNDILLCWVMLLTSAGKCNSDGYIFLTSDIPYTSEMLADEYDMQHNTVRLALDTFQKLKMVELDDKGIHVSGWGEYQNVEGMELIREQTKIRVQKHREKLKQLKQCNVTCNVTETNSNAIDIDLELDQERDIKDTTLSTKPIVDRVPHQKIMDLYHSICTTLPKIQSMTKARQETIRVWYKSTPDITIFEDYFKKVQASDFLTGRDGKWLKCGFDWIIKPSNRQKVLEGNYDNKKNNASTKESGGVIHGGEYVDFNKLLSGNR